MPGTGDCHGRSKENRGGRSHLPRRRQHDGLRGVPAALQPGQDRYRLDMGVADHHGRCAAAGLRVRQARQAGAQSGWPVCVCTRLVRSLHGLPDQHHLLVRQLDRQRCHSHRGGGLLQLLLPDPVRAAGALHRGADPGVGVELCQHDRTGVRQPRADGHHQLRAGADPGHRHLRLVLLRCRHLQGRVQRLRRVELRCDLQCGGVDPVGVHRRRVGVGDRRRGRKPGKERGPRHPGRCVPGRHRLHRQLVGDHGHGAQRRAAGV